MATTSSSSTSKAKGDSQNLTRSKSNIGRKPKLPSSVSSEEGSSDQKPEKPLPNYLKPTISSRPDPVKFVKKNNNSVEDNQKLLRRRSFDRPPSSLTSPSTSSARTQKSLNVSPSRSRDKPTVPREKPVLPQRSSSFGGSRGVPRGASSVKAPHPVAPKKSGLSSSSSSLKSKKEGSAIKKASEKEIPLDTASLSSAQEEEEEVIKVESDHVQAANEIEEPKEETKETKELQVEVVESVESCKQIESGVPTIVAPHVVEDCAVVVVPKEDEKEEKVVINEVKAEEKIEETKEHEHNEDNKGQEEEEVKKNIDEVETLEKIDIEKKEVESVEETTEVKEEEVKEEEKEKVNEEVKDEEATKEKQEEKKEEVKDEKKVEEEKEKVKEEERKKKEVVKGKKESPSAYNDVIASKMQENPRKNKVLALAGAFQTVIDYETAASK